MGIPSYFSYIIKNHSNIIRTLKYHNSVEHTVIHGLYMDCNSIIYDAIRQVGTTSDINCNESPIKIGTSSYQNAIIEYVIEKIKMYVAVIAPTELVYIAFDGVAPFAKMEQQRTRRYKSAFMQTIDFENSAVLKPEQYANIFQSGFSSCNITPGTLFMEILSKRIEYAFSLNTQQSTLITRKYIVSTSKEPGEGEHKMFAYMREHANENQTLAVYGLDADLIMLSIVHSLICNNIYICREAPEFSLKSLGNVGKELEKDKNELLMLNVDLFSKSILKEMNIHTFDTGRIYDYIFLCFFLGNDFLPHFPALNLRTCGIQYLLNAYAKEISANGTSSKYLISTKTGKIQWKWVFVLLRELAKYENDFIKKEYHDRNHMHSRISTSDKTKKDREVLFENTPMLYRADEHYISPDEQGWESRYYKIAFGEDGCIEHHSLNTKKENLFIKNVCINYLEGLEWVFKYYTEGCPHWRWKYNYNYPPLLSDLIQYIPQFETDFFVYDKNTARCDQLSMTPYSADEQLMYVLPRAYHYLIQNEYKEQVIKKMGKEKYHYLFPELDQLKFKWMFCRYFWECHLDLPEMQM